MIDETGLTTNVFEMTEWLILLPSLPLDEPHCNRL